VNTAFAPAWTCPQCQRRVPGREPRCHCGFERTSASPAPSFPAPPPLSPAGAWGRGAVLLAALAAGLIGVLVYAAVRHDANLEVAVPSRTEPTRGEAIYPALPPLPAAARARPARAGAGTAAGASAANAARRPPPSQTTVELDLVLRRIAAETSVLELSYRTFAGPCLAPRNDPSSIGLGSAPDRDWLASLKTARLISGVTLREHGATVDCEAARRSLVARADALKSDLAAAETLAHASGVRPEHWHDLMAMHRLDVWDRY
jgi:hypothetical protein